jgi:excisionase family DNA binding protein
MNSDQLVTARQLETLLGVKKNTIYKMRKAGKLTFYRVGTAGGGIRFRVEEILAALRQPARHGVSESAIK